MSHTTIQEENFLVIKKEENVSHQEESYQNDDFFLNSIFVKAHLSRPKTNSTRDIVKLSLVSPLLIKCHRFLPSGALMLKS
jgi:hypothetical protein